MAQGGGWGNVLAAGVQGYLQGQGLVAAQRKSESEQAYLDEKRTRQRQEWADEDSLKADLRAAVAPVEVVQGAGGVTLPAEMDNRDVGLPENAALPNGGLQAGARVGNTAYADPGAAQQAAAQANLPSIVAGRQASVYNTHGMPEKAALLEQRQAALEKTALEYKEKGIFDGVRKFRQGDKDGAMAALKKSGQFNPEGEVTFAPEEMDLPGIGKIKTYTATFQNKNADGTVTPVRLNSHELSLATMPYEKQLQVLGQGVERQDKQKDREERAADRAIDNKRADALASATIGLRAAQTSRAERPAATGGGRGGAGGPEKATREGRLVVQTLLGNVTREIRETDASIKDEQKNMFPGDPPTPRMKELIAQRSQLAQRRGDLNSEMENIPRPTSGKAAAKEQAAPKSVDTSQGKAMQLTSAADYAKVPPGGLYLKPGDTTPYRKKAQ